METLTDGSHLVRWHILVVDDDELVNSLVEAFLTHDGHTVETASNGEEGWVKFRAAEFQAVIVDWFMPGISGDRLAAAIKQASPATCVVMITGGDTWPLIAQERLEGVDVLLRKPFSWGELREALQKSTVRRRETGSMPSGAKGGRD